VSEDSERVRTYGVQARDREPLIAFMLDALRRDGCRIIYEPPPNEAPFRITFETRTGERIGIIAYAFLANTKPTRNRPDDEHRFQVKYGSKDGKLHKLWQDPYGLYVTLFVGINPELGFFVGADPILHSPTKFFISVEFKQQQAEEILRRGWHAWERERRSRALEEEGPVEVLVGGTAASFLRYVRFEREALREDQGHRQLLAERSADVASPIASAVAGPIPSPARLHELAREFEMSEAEVLDLIAGARRLKMAVRGWVAEEHLVRRLLTVPGVSDCVRDDEEGGPDVKLRFENSRVISLECKNVLRQRTADGLARVDFQRTRASKSDPCSRYYSASDFDIVAACLHAVSERWEFQFARSAWLDPHRLCTGKLSHLVKVDDRWSRPVEQVLREAAKG
jgi:hypothetical protein